MKFTGLPVPSPSIATKQRLTAYEAARRRDAEAFIPALSAAHAQVSAYTELSSDPRFGDLSNRFRDA